MKFTGQIMFGLGLGAHPDPAPGVRPSPVAAMSKRQSPVKDWKRPFLSTLLRPGTVALRENHPASIGCSSARMWTVSRCALGIVLLTSIAARADDLALSGNPYDSIVARNIFSLVPMPTNDPADQKPPDPPAKI